MRIVDSLRLKSFSWRWINSRHSLFALEKWQINILNITLSVLDWCLISEINRRSDLSDWDNLWDVKRWLCHQCSHKWKHRMIRVVYSSIIEYRVTNFYSSLQQHWNASVSDEKQQ